MKKAAIATFLTVVALALLPSPGAYAAGPSGLQMSIVPADARWVMHLDMEKFASSAVFKLLTESGRGFDIQKKTNQFSEKLKMDPLKDIKGVTVFGRAKAGEEPVVAVSGNFDKVRLLGLLKTESSFKETPYGKYTLYNWEGEHFGVFVNDNLALITEREADIKSALDALDGKAKNVSASPLMSLLKKESAGAMIQFALADIGSLTGQVKDAGAAHALPAMLTQMQSITGVVSETGDKLNTKIEIGAESDQVAQSIQQTVQGLVALLNLQFKEDAQPITRGITVKTDGDRVRIDASYLVPELAKIIQQRREHKGYKAAEKEAPKH
jgi:hypothetical protein